MLASWYRDASLGVGLALPWHIVLAMLRIVEDQTLSRLQSTAINSYGDE